jgi:hypothetical protein
MQEIAVKKNLLNLGPVVEAEIFSSEEAFLKQKNYSMPENFAKTKLLIDTGSNISGLDYKIIKLLNLASCTEGEEWVKGQFGNWQVLRYNCVLYLPIFKKKALQFEVLGGNYNGSPYDGVIGRDVLRYCEFKYDGVKNSFSLVVREF